VHVRSASGDAKFWLVPVVQLASSSGYDARTLRELTQVVSQNAELIERPGMNTSPKSVRVDDDSMWVSLVDGPTIAFPLAWFPWLLEATPEQCLQFELSSTGLHCDALDEDISVAVLLGGQGGATSPRRFNAVRCTSPRADSPERLSLCACLHRMTTQSLMHPLLETRRVELLALAHGRGVTGVRVFGSMSRDDA